MQSSFLVYRQPNYVTSRLHSLAWQGGGVSVIAVLDIHPRWWDDYAGPAAEKNRSRFHLGKSRMPIEKKKNLLIPLNNPRRPTPSARIVIAILRPPLLVLGFVFGNLYKLCFGWLDKRMARQNEQCFAEDVRTYLAFLFSEHGAKVIPNEGVPFPPGFDGAYVTVAVGNLRLRFVRGRGDFSVRLASALSLRTSGKTRQLVADGLGQWDMSAGARYYTLETFEPILRARLERLQQALSKDRFETTLNNAVKTHNDSVDAYTATLRQSGIIPKDY